MNLQNDSNDNLDMIEIKDKDRQKFNWIEPVYRPPTAGSSNSQGPTKTSSNPLCEIASAHLENKDAGGERNENKNN
jgi:hypothetical protein